MENQHAILVTYLGATNTKMNRIKLTSKRFHESVIINNHDGISNAISYLEKKGFEVISKCEFGSNFDLIICDTFKSIK
jgi:glycine betaine/choline ABC-type transport system substrate-binding protein